MTNCTQESFRFPVCKRRRVEVNFQGGDITSDGGVLLLQQVDQQLGLSEAVARTLDDPRRQASCDHDGLRLLRQRVYALALGYEDLNDHQTLRLDLAIQTALGCTDELASSSTLCRWENRADRETARRMHEVIVEQFIASFKKVPQKLILDFDATDDAVHGKQEGRFFHGYYDHYCFLPLYVFCRNQLLVSYLRPSKIDGAKHAWAILALLVKRLRQAWPQVKIIFRADSGFCRWRMLSWCERNNVGYIVGIAKNKRLNAITAQLQREARDCYAELGSKVRWFSDLHYAAGSWNRRRRIIAKIEHSGKGSNPRYVVTNLKGDGQVLYEKLYCARGEMENRIKEQQLCLFADRTSCGTMRANQLRLWFSSLAYVMLQTLREVGLKETELERAQCDTIRLKVLKIGAQIRVTFRKVWIALAESYPWRTLFAQIWANLRRLPPRPIPN